MSAYDSILLGTLFSQWMMGCYSFYYFTILRHEIFRVGIKPALFMSCRYEMFKYQEIQSTPNKVDVGNNALFFKSILLRTVVFCR
jgi:hypothetical protein